VGPSRRAETLGLRREQGRDGYREVVEEIITALSRIRWLFVIARNSSFTYKGQAVDVKRVGRELGCAMSSKAREWWRDYLRRAKAGEDIRSIRVWGTVGNKTDIVRQWRAGRRPDADSRRAARYAGSPQSASLTTRT